MTELDLRSKVVATAQKYLGLNERDAKHLEILSIYNNHRPLARGYAVMPSDPWCATFVSAMGIKCGLSDIMPTECGCGNMVELYKKIGRWVEADDYVPKIGDIVMYDWQDTTGSAKDNVGYPDHVGIVAMIDGNNMQIIEGNISDSVGYRKLRVNEKNIRGYCIPDYASKADVKQEVREEPKEEPKVENKLVETPATNPLNGKPSIDPARFFLKAMAGEYTVTASWLNVRAGAGTNKAILHTIPNGTKVRCYGYYSIDSEKEWLYIAGLVNGTRVEGFCSSTYLAKQ
jgi:uncharacterized protein YgiM (DUF1202 family)